MWDMIGARVAGAKPNGFARKQLDSRALPFCLSP
jgi:hypothetical protein